MTLADLCAGENRPSLVSWPVTDVFHLKHVVVSCAFDVIQLFSVVWYVYLKIKIYRTIILPVVLYGCETWSLTLREERRLRVFENRVLRRIFGPKRDEVTGERRTTT